MLYRRARGLASEESSPRAVVVSVPLLSNSSPQKQSPWRGAEGASRLLNTLLFPKNHEQKNPTTTKVPAVSQVSSERGNATAVDNSGTQDVAAEMPVLVCAWVCQRRRETWAVFEGQCTWLRSTREDGVGAVRGSSTSGGGEDVVAVGGSFGFLYQPGASSSCRAVEPWGLTPA